jgi:hypothetical protein
MTSITNVQSLPRTGCSKQSPMDFIIQNPKECAIFACLVGGYATAFYASADLANVVAKETLGYCDPWMHPERPYYPCADTWNKLSLSGSVSLALFTTSLALSYSSTILDKIKSLPLFGKGKNSSEVESKGSDIDLFVSAQNLALAISITSAGTAANQIMSSLFKFSELASYQLSETCISEIKVDLTNTVKYDHCASLIKDGNAKLLAAGLALTAFGAAFASKALIGRVSKWANKTPDAKP